MIRINRRNFIKKGIQTSAGLAGGLSMANIMAFKSTNSSVSKSISVFVPMPIQVVIDDVGWWSGKDGSKWQEPYRTGIDRNHVVADYEAIIRLGKALDIRPQAAMVLCEWDRENILKDLPTSTWMRAKWDNSKWAGPWLEEAADAITRNKEHFEFTMHGIGHEWWENGAFTRAEWATEDGTMRPRDLVERHLDFFSELMVQNKLGDFPESFIPTAFNHGFGLTGNHKVSMAELLKKRGVNYINTPFGQIQNRELIQYETFGFDSGVMTIDRGRDLLDWNNIGLIPSGEIKGPTCGMHWPNLLHEDPERNSEVVEGWVKLLKPYRDKPGTILAKNSISFQKQLVHYAYTNVEVKGSVIEIDFSNTDQLDSLFKGDELILKVSSPVRLSFSSETIKIVKDASLKQNNTILYTMNLKRGKNKNVWINFDNEG